MRGGVGVGRGGEGRYGICPYDVGVLLWYSWGSEMFEEVLGVAKTPLQKLPRPKSKTMTLQGELCEYIENSRP